jgi:hypothetical protein
VDRLAEIKKKLHWDMMLDTDVEWLIYKLEEARDAIEDYRQEIAHQRAQLAHLRKTLETQAGKSGLP